MRPVSSTGALGYDLVYDSKNQGGLGSSGMLHLLPDKPEQPECRQFMSNGSCKYGSDCKYHHPRERIAQLATNSLGPLMLPLRPVSCMCIALHTLISQFRYCAHSFSFCFQKNKIAFF